MFWFGQMLITNFPHRRKKCFLNIQTIQCYVWNSTLILKRRWLPLGGDAMLQSFAQITLFILDVWNIKWQCRKWIWPQYMYIYILCIFNPNYQFLIKMKILKNVRIFFLIFEANSFGKGQIWGHAKIWGQNKIYGHAKLEAISEDSQILRPGQARPGFRVSP